MQGRSTPRAQRALLALAVLLYMAGIAAEPVVHAGEVPGVWSGWTVQEGERSQGGLPSGPDSPVPHADFDCILCQTAHVVALAGPVGSPFAQVAPQASAARLADPRPSLPLVLSPRPRGPPAS